MDGRNERWNERTIERWNCGHVNIRSMWSSSLDDSHHHLVTIEGAILAAGLAQQCPCVAGLLVVEGAAADAGAREHLVAEVEQLVEHPHRCILHAKLPVPPMRIILWFGLRENGFRLVDAVQGNHQHQQVSEQNSDLEVETVFNYREGHLLVQVRIDGGDARRTTMKVFGRHEHVRHSVVGFAVVAQVVRRLRRRGGRGERMIVLVVVVAGGGQRRGGSRSAAIVRQAGRWQATAAVAARASQLGR